MAVTIILVLEFLCRAGLAVTKKGPSHPRRPSSDPGGRPHRDEGKGPNIWYEQARRLADRLAPPGDAGGRAPRLPRARGVGEGGRPEEGRVGHVRGGAGLGAPGRTSPSPEGCGPETGVAPGAPKRPSHLPGTGV